ncbi:acyl-CoA dehydrogenase family protein [Polycladidibacter hongkongensis]|uniref:acyl-CoA dehydrogenase family protein n=1 Tax=Polycladidibacter hongkongensis TaxID=1647556 RepID=UPI0008364E40|nr:acyl-CoA dehydrogenase family protein [Pseudovibrio hongkongensis]
MGENQVHNQSGPYQGMNLAEGDPLLMAELDGEVRDDSARDDLLAVGADAGALPAQEMGRVANELAPSLQQYDAFGERVDRIVYHPAYHALMRRGMDAGLHCAAVARQQGARQANLQRARRFMIAGQVDAGHLCPLTMTNAAAEVLALDVPLYEAWQPALASRIYDQRSLPVPYKQGVTLGMGLTERQGGSDLRQIESKAQRSVGDSYILNGHKWFLSAPASDAFLILAKVGDQVSCFLVPRLREDGSNNGLRLVRLKNKLGNHSNASAELEILGAHGQLVGDVGRGIKSIMAMVTPTRLDCVLGAAATMRAAVARAVFHCRGRMSFGRKLVAQPLMQEVLGDMALDVAAVQAAAIHLAQDMDSVGGATLGAASQGRAKPAAAARLRILIPAMKYWACKLPVAVVGEALECLGGNGYVEEHGLARLYREAPLNGIWEGSGNVIALDLVRALAQEPEAFKSVLEGIGAGLGKAGPVSVAALRALAEQASGDERAARLLAEQLAMSFAGACLRRMTPDFIADAFCRSRLGGQWRGSYGMLAGGFDSRGIVDWLYPP